MRKVKVEAPHGPNFAKITDVETGEKVALAKSLEIRFCAESRKLIGKLTTFVKDERYPDEEDKVHVLGIFNEDEKAEPVLKHETVEVVSIEMEEAD